MTQEDAREFLAGAGTVPAAAIATELRRLLVECEAFATPYDSSLYYAAKTGALTGAVSSLAALLDMAPKR